MPHRAVLKLIRRQVMEPFDKKLLHIEIVARRLHKYFRIPGPSQTFIPLRAVGGHIQEISPLSPENIGKQLIQFRNTAAKMPGLSQVRIDCNRRKLFRFRLPRKFLQLQITESEERQQRMPGLDSLPAYIPEFRLRVPVIVPVEIPFLIQHFPVQNPYFLSCLRVHGKLHISGHFLSKIHNRFSGRSHKNTLCLHTFFLADFFTLLRNQVPTGLFKYHGILPVCRTNPRVVPLSVVNLTEPHRTLCILPAAVRPDQRPVALSIRQTKLRK